MTDRRNPEKIKCLKSNDNDGTTYENLCDIVKTVLSGKFKSVNVYVRKIGQSQVYI